MNSIEELLKSLAEPEVHAEENFKAKLRRDLHHTRRARASRDFSKLILAFSLGSTMVMLVLFVARPGLASHANHLIFPGNTANYSVAQEIPNPQSSPYRPLMEPVLDGFANPTFAEPLPVLGMGKLIREETIILRHFELENGEKAVMFYRPKPAQPAQPAPYRVY